MESPFTSEQFLGFENLTKEQANTITEIEDFKLIEVDDHGTSRRYSVFEVDGNYWKVEFEHSSNEGIYRDGIDPPVRVQRVEVVKVIWDTVEDNDAQTDLKPQSRSPSKKPTKSCKSSPMDIDPFQ